MTFSQEYNFPIFAVWKIAKITRTRKLHEHENLIMCHPTSFCANSAKLICSEMTKI